MMAAVIISAIGWLFAGYLALAMVGLVWTIVRGGRR